MKRLLHTWFANNTEFKSHNYSLLFNFSPLHRNLDFTEAEIDECTCLPVYQHGTLLQGRLTLRGTLVSPPSSCPLPRPCLTASICTLTCRHRAMQTVSGAR
jgi:hypothetical protein